MKNLIKYGCYTLLAVAVFTGFWLMCGFISMEFDMRKWNSAERLFIVLFTAIALPFLVRINKNP